MMSGRSFVFVTALFVAIAGGADAQQPVHFTLVAETGSPTPGQTGFAFTYFAGAPALDGQRVVFPAITLTSFNAYGLYAFEAGASSLLVDLNSTVPGTAQPFKEINPWRVSSDGGVTAFNGSIVTTPCSGGQPTVTSGIYTESGGVLGLIAQGAMTPLPGGAGQFCGAQDPSIGGGTVAFSGSGVGTGNAIYADFAGTLELVADTSTPVPGGVGNFLALGGHAADGESVVFAGRDNGGPPANYGLYIYSGGSLEVLVDSNTPVPGSGTTFGSTALGSPAVDAGDVVFVGSNSGSSSAHGLFLIKDQSIVRLVDASAGAPGGSDPFLTIGPVSFDGDTVAFLAETAAGRSGIYHLPIGGELTEVIATGDTLDGATVVQLYLGQDGVSGDQVGFTVRFDSSFPYVEAVYVATIGAPSVPASSPSLYVILVLSMALFGFVASRQAGRP